MDIKEMSISELEQEIKYRKNIETVNGVIHYRTPASILQEIGIFNTDDENITSEERYFKILDWHHKEKAKRELIKDLDNAFDTLSGK